MKTTLNTSGRVERVAKFVGRNLFVPILRGAPPFFLIAVIRAASPTSPSWLQQINDWVVLHPLLIAAVVLTYMVVLDQIIARVDAWAKKEEPVDVRGLLALFETLEGIVGIKAKRFEDHLKQKMKEVRPADPGEVFTSITQPDQQLAFLVQGIHSFFNVLGKEGVTFSVSVSVVEEERITEWLYYWPESAPPLISIEKLNRPRSTMLHCVSKGHIIIIEDTAKEARCANGHYIPVDEAYPEEGAMICYPVQYSGEICFVITVSADKKKTFRRKKQQLYEWSLKHFVVRMKVEQGLLKLKERTTNYGT